jgi:hypothetical protein
LAGSFSESGDTWSGAGTISIAGATITTSNLHSSGANISISSGTLAISSGTTAAAGSLALGGGTLTVSGELDITSSFSASGAPLVNGVGKLVLGSAVAGTIGSGNCSVHLTLSEVTFLNQGTLTFGASPGVGAGAIAMQNGAHFINEGTFNNNSYDSGCGYGIAGSNYSFYNTGGTASITNTGSFIGNAGSVTLNVDVAFNNLGWVKAASGTLRFIAGGVSSQVATGGWKVSTGAAIVLGGGEFLIGEAVNLSEVRIEGATVRRVAVTGAPKGYLNQQPYASRIVVISGTGESVGSGFSSSSIEMTPTGRNEWKALCGPLTPSLLGEFSCQWNTANGFYPDGSYQLRAQLSDSSTPANTAPTAFIMVLVDNTVPTGSVSTPSDLHGPQPVSGTAADTGSGVASWQLQIAHESSSEWTNACAMQTTPVSGSTYQCTVEGFSYTDGAYQLRALITDNAGNTYTTSPVSTTIDNMPPTNNSPPMITGWAWAGQWLKASTGQWSGTEPFSYAYQWRLCDSSGANCTNISGATSSTYAVTKSELGETLRVLVTAANPLSSAASISEATAVITEASCTDSWIGASGQAWQTASDWSTGAVPNSSDIACIKAGVTVQMTGGTNQTGYLWSQGSLVIGGGSLEIMNTLEPSTASSLTLTGGVLVVVGELDVSSSFVAGTATVSGSGRVVLKSGAVGSINTSCSYFTLSGVTLQNEGSLTSGAAGGSGNGEIHMVSGAQLVNAGTFNEDHYDNTSCWNGQAINNNGGSVSPSVTNTGTFSVDIGSGHTAIVSVPFNNEGTVEVKTGTLSPTGGGSSSAGTWTTAVGATVGFMSGTYSSVNDKASGATFVVSGGTLGVGSGTSTIGSLTLAGGTLSVGGELDVSSSMSSSGSAVVSGAGRVVVQASATGSIDSVSCSLLTLAGGVTFVNDGTVAVGVAGGSAGQIDMQEGAQLQNAGTLNAYSHAEGCVPGSNAATILNYGGTAPSITNTGTFQSAVGAYTAKIGVEFNNQGKTNGVSGTVEFTGGGVPEQVAFGSWAVQSAANIVLAAGKYLIGEGVDLSAVQITGATIERSK